MSSNEPFGLAGAACILTGATSAVGLACARRLVQMDAVVFLVDDDADLVQEAAAKIGGTAVVGDPASEAAAEEAVAGAMIRTGRLDRLIHCDMLQRRLALEDTDMQEWDSIMAVNMRGAFSFARVALRAMSTYGNGAIVLVTPLAGTSPVLPGADVFAASTAGVHGLTRALARSGGPHGVRANAVVTGYLDTPTSRRWSEAERGTAAAATPLGRPGLPAEAASAAVWLASSAAAFVTGAVLRVDGGLAA
jgi:NAD(P)-dependent dehydrogenase (short-subunit alcohol dehydrogenase family)